MSKSTLSREETLAAESPRLERWLILMLLALVPMIAALLVERAFVTHLAAVSGVLFVAGLAMFFRGERRTR